MSDLVDRLNHCSQNTSDEYLHELTGRAAKRIAALEAGVRNHVTDLRKTADVLERWQDPMVGPFDATIAEIRKAANELEALEQNDE
jgi:hypothetical protein